MDNTYRSSNPRYLEAIADRILADHETKQKAKAKERISEFQQRAAYYKRLYGINLSQYRQILRKQRKRDAFCKKTNTAAILT